MSSRRWQLKPPPPSEVIISSQLPELLTQLLYNRGITDAAQANLFLNGSEDISADPFLLPDMPPAVIRICRAILRGEQIAIYGDYDADGITATAILVKGIGELGGQVTPYIPHRINEGYGLNLTAIKKLHGQGISLIITVDCGVSNLNEVRKASQLGIDIIITDHHEPPAELPQALAVINPKRRDSQYPFSEFSGAGVAFKLLQALYKNLNKTENNETLIDLAAIGTVADICPLVGENRYLVKKGLELMNRSPRPGIAAIVALTGIKQGAMDSESIGWIIAPRLNAAGRIATAAKAYELLMAESPSEAIIMATWLEEKNRERKLLTGKVISDARDHVIAEGIGNILIADDNSYHPGIAGLAAGRIADEFYRPTVIINTGETTSVGSCRSIPEFNIVEALEKCRNLFVRFGGHSQAAGFTISTANIPSLKEKLFQIAAAEIGQQELCPCIEIDASLNFAKLNGSTYQTINQLAPFGCGNPLPTFLSKQVNLTDYSSMGSGKHLRMTFQQNGVKWQAVAFNQGDTQENLASQLDIVYNLEVDHWQGKECLRLNVLDFKSSTR